MLLSTSLPPERFSAASETIYDEGGGRERGRGRRNIAPDLDKGSKKGQNGSVGVPDLDDDDKEEEKGPPNIPAAFTLNGRGGNLRGTRGAPSEEQGNELRNLGVGGGGGRPTELSLLLRKANQGRTDGRMGSAFWRTDKRLIISHSGLCRSVGPKGLLGFEILLVVLPAPQPAHRLPIGQSRKIQAEFSQSWTSLFVQSFRL